MNKSLQQCLALAGVAQSAFMVRQLASHGMVGQDKLNTVIRSLFVTHPKSTEEVYGNVSRLNLGMQVLRELIQGDDENLKSPEVVRYLFGILHLEAKLHKRKGMLSAIGKGLDKIDKPALDDPDLGNPRVISALAGIYQDTLSTLPFRIQVTGEVKFLKSEDIAEKIRAVLLGGIRSAVLWRQLGGRRWHLLLFRKRISRNLLLLMNRVHEIH